MAAILTRTEITKQDAAHTAGQVIELADRLCRSTFGFQEDAQQLQAVLDDLLTLRQNLLGHLERQSRKEADRPPL